MSDHPISFYYDGLYSSRPYSKASSVDGKSNGLFPATRLHKLLVQYNLLVEIDANAEERRARLWYIL